MDLSVTIERLRAMGVGFLAALPNIALGIIVFLLFLVVARLAGNFVAAANRRYRRLENLGLVLACLTRWVVGLVGLLVALTVVFPSFRADDFVQLLGITSVAIGFAFRDILQNFLAGILILITQPFRVGDQIVVQGFEGTVENIETRATVIRTYDSRRIVIPNATLFTNSVTVNTAYPKRRLEYDVGIGYGDDIEKARLLILEAIAESGVALPDPQPEALVMELAESSVNIRARWWIEPPRQLDALDARDRVLATIKDKLVANGIDLPFPTRQVLFHDQTESTDGDRARQREGWPAGKGEVPPARSIAAAIEGSRGRTQEAEPDESGKP